VLVVIATVAQTVAARTDDATGNNVWKYRWMFDAIWELLYFCVLTAVAVLWRPRANNVRYGYGEYFMEGEGEPGEVDEQIQLDTVSVNGGELSYRKKTITAPSTSTTTRQQAHEPKEVLSRALKKIDQEITDMVIEVGEEEDGTKKID